MLPKTNMLCCRFAELRADEVSEFVVHLLPCDDGIDVFPSDVGEHHVDPVHGHREPVRGGAFGDLTTVDLLDHGDPFVGFGFAGAGGDQLAVGPEVAFRHVPHPGVGDAEDLPSFP